MRWIGRRLSLLPALALHRQPLSREQGCPHRCGGALGQGQAGVQHRAGVVGEPNTQEDSPGMQQTDQPVLQRYPARTPARPRQTIAGLVADRVAEGCGG